VVDTPGRDDEIARLAILRADTLVTPMNDSFVDLDLIGQVHPENYKITKPSFYAELIWNSRTERAKTTGRSVDWVVLRNRLQHVDSHNLRRVGAALESCGVSDSASSRATAGLPGALPRPHNRDLWQIGDVGIGHITAAGTGDDCRARILAPTRASSPSPAEAKCPARRGRACPSDHPS
jgi:chromosome partitioning protein